MTILEEIVKNRLTLLKKETQSLSFESVIEQSEKLLASGYKPVEFLSGFKKNIPFLIAEIKKSSPSKGVIRKDLNVKEIAGIYERSDHVNAVSILTEPDYFSGKYEYISQVKAVTKKPLLMKDFIVDPYQVYVGFLAGASAFLLIAAILNDAQIADFINLSQKLDMNIIFETHSLSEYKKAMEFDLKIIGINNRDLKTFTTDINNTVAILGSAGKPEDRIVISESGLKTKADIKTLRRSKVDGFLIGERFMKYKDVNRSIDEIFGESNV